MGFEDFLNKPAPADDKRPQIEKEQEKLRGRKDEIDNFSDEVSYALKKHPDWTVGDFEDEMWKLWKKNEAEEKIQNLRAYTRKTKEYIISSSLFFSLYC